METSSEKENWKKTLTNAEVIPSDSVWEGVELQLDKTEVVRLRRSVFIYKWMAAACLILAIVAFGSVYTIQKGGNGERQNEMLSEGASKEQIQSNHEQQGNDAIALQIEQPSSTNFTHTVRNDEKIALTESNSSGNLTTNKNSFLSFNIWKISPEISNWGNSKSKDQPIGRENNSEIVKSPLLKETDQAENFTLLEEEAEEQTSIRSAERFWTSVGFSAGTFNNTTPTNGNAPASALRSFTAGQTAASESNSPGYSYAINLAVGAKISKRWLLQGGMSYIAQLSDYTATSVVTNQNADNTQTISAASINQFEKKSDDTHPELTILASTPYSVNNEIQLISFPVQAGYILVDRKVALQLNTGFSTDLFMQNTITPQVENLEKTTQGRGDDSPYRPVNFSGLVGTEVSYRFAENYRIALSPGLRYPINSIYKSDLGVKSSPLTFDVALRFRYILK